jgi:hypothetical protein
MFDPSDSEVFWLNMTNVALGLVTLIAFVAVSFAVVREVAARARKHATVPATDDAHAFLHPELGLTMADGGEPTDRKKSDKKRSAR